MLGMTLAALIMLQQASATWRDDGSVEITATFLADDPRNPFPQGRSLMDAKAAEACGDTGEPALISEPAVNAIALVQGRPQVTMSAIYACARG